ncbi:cytochrome b/b6 domain-containing protein [Magnetovibrio sp. PR-2]|uniref:cytochrome b/b6 domain-containing protein n=1 Tax=Magnetovibrio sp. PR-2 TaxID=3120356 RepID=UPI002FCE0243
MLRLTPLFVVALFLAVFPARAQHAPGENPNAPELFVPNPQTERTLWQRLGPGNGPVRKNSVLPDVHKDVPGFANARYCLSCHEGQDKNLHYARTSVKCKTCHISRPIAGIRNPAATMFADHRAEKVCARCHKGATAAMGSYVIHEPSPFVTETQNDFPALFYAAWTMVALAGTVFLVFAPYVALWAVKEIRMAFGKTRVVDPVANADMMRVERFSLAERMFHTLLALCFMALSVTGLSWMFIETPFGQTLVAVFGDYKNAIALHRVVGLSLMLLFVVHIVYILQQVDWTQPGSLKSPDSLVWRLSDFRAFWHHLKWLVGRAEHPAFDRWAWWQKFDYWALWWGTIIVGVTGLVMFDPVVAAQYLDGWILNVARWVHKIEALLAMAHIFVVHFFIESYRPRAFPLSDHVFHGAADVEHMRDEHPNWIGRLEATDQLKHMAVQQPPKVVQAVYFGFGIAMVGLGLFLLVGALLFMSGLS